jgi:glyoxylase-like metal-dependent hydrolase (beta-lactamase superfamily II)
LRISFALLPQGGGWGASVGVDRAGNRGSRDRLIASITAITASDPPAASKLGRDDSVSRARDKSRPTRPFWNMLNTPYLDRLAAAGARADEIDLVMCTHLHHDHVGWNTQLRDGRWVPTFPNARYVFSKSDFEYYLKADADPKTAPVEFGTFRECVLPVVEAGRADLVTGPHRLDDCLEIIPAPGHSAGHVVFKLESNGRCAIFIGDVFHHLLQVYYPHWNFPKNSDPEAARASRHQVLKECASVGALTLPCHVGSPFAGYIDFAKAGFEPRF